MQEEIKQNKLIAVYGRVSTSNQEDQKTIEAQLSEVYAFAKQNNLTIVREYLDEGWSGDILARPELDKLRNEAKDKLWDAVLIYDPDRLGRQLFYQQIVIDELKQLNIDVLFVTVPPVNNSADELMFGVRGLFAQYEKTKITERFRIGKVNRVKNGHILVTEAPYGYTYVPNKGKRGSEGYVAGHYVVNNIEAQVVKDLFSWVADEGLTLRAVVRRLQERHILPRKSKRGVWCTSTLSTLFRNKTYIGEGHYGASTAIVPLNPLKKEGYKKVKKTSRRIKPEEEWIKINTPVIIDEALFNRAQQRLKENFETTKRNTKNEYLLSHRIQCACGCKRAGEGPQKGKHLYYRCTSRVKSFPLKSECLEKGINARIADELVWKRLQKLLNSPDLLLKQAERWLNKNEERSTKTAVDLVAIEKELTNTKKQQDRFLDAYGSGAIDIDKLKELTLPLKEKISKLTDQLDKGKRDLLSNTSSVLPTKSDIDLFVSKARSTFMNLNFEAKQGIVRVLVEKIVGTKEKLQVYGYIPVTSNINVFTINRHGLNTCRPADCEVIPFSFSIKMPVVAR